MNGYTVNASTPFCRTNAANVCPYAKFFLWNLYERHPSDILFETPRKGLSVWTALPTCCRIEVFGVTIEPLWVEAYCYDETHFPDYNTHRSRKQKNRFGQMYFHERGYGGVDICLSNSEDFCLSFLLKATLANGHFLTQTQLPRALLSTGKTKADFEHLEDILHPANARHTICHTTRVNLAKPCYSDAPLTSFALDAIPKYDFRFARKNLRENVRAYLLAYMAAHPDCTEQECRAECRRVFGWVPNLVRTWVHN